FGVGDDKTSVSGDIFFYHHNSTFNRDRGNSANPPFLSTNSSPYNLQLADAVVIAAGGTPATPANPLTFGHAPFGTNGSAPANLYTYSGGRSSFFNFNQFSNSYPEQERFGGYASFDTKVCEDEVQVYGDFYYTKVKTHNELAPSATGSFNTPGQVTLAIPPHMDLNGIHPLNTPAFAGEPLHLDAMGHPLPGEFQTNVPVNAFNPFNPFNQIIAGGSRARLAEFGNRLFDNQSDAWLATLGV